MADRRRLVAYVFAFFACLFVLIASGRLGSADAGSELTAANDLVLRGTLGADPSPDLPSWPRAPNGKVYDGHDIGAVILMLPSAWAGARASHLTHSSPVATVPVITKVAADLTYAVVCAIGCAFLFACLAEWYSPRAAFLLSVVFALGTFFVAYARVAWDVAPAACAVCAVLYGWSRIVRGDPSIRTFALTGLALAIACSFHFALFPPLTLLVASLVMPGASRWRGGAALIVVCLLGLVPTFAYNFVRTGSPLHSAVPLDYYVDGFNPYDGSLLNGSLGLLFSGNHGLFMYAPVALLCLGLPVVWRGLASAQRTLIVFTLASAAVYFMSLARAVNWGVFGWGPRELLPVLPFVFFAAAAVLMQIGRRYAGVAIAIGIVVVTINIAPALTNWNIVEDDYPPAANPDAGVPYALSGTWIGLMEGLHGQPLHFAASDPKSVADDPSRRFPDIWTARLSETSHKGRLAAIAIVVVLLAGLLGSLLRIVALSRAAVLQRLSDARSSPSSDPASPPAPAPDTQGAAIEL